MSLKNPVTRPGIDPGTVRLVTQRLNHYATPSPPVPISIYLKSVLRFKFLNLGTYHPGTLYLQEQGCEDPWLLFEAKRGPRAKRLRKH
jgi:hypothetical protein